MQALSLDAELADFISQGALIRLASASPTGVPDLCFGLACFVDPERRRLRVAFDGRQADPVLQLAVHSGRAALVFTDPVSYRTVQIKTTDARVAAVPASDHAEVARRVSLANGQLALIGFGDPFAATLNGYEEERLVMLHCSIHALFDQTPGPNAGKPLAEAP
jgi:hypothetical protein